MAKSPLKRDVDARSVLALKKKIVDAFLKLDANVQ